MYDNPTTSSLLSRTFNLFGAGFVPFVSLALIVQSPGLILTLLIYSFQAKLPGEFQGDAALPAAVAGGVLGLGVFVVTIVLTMVATAALVYGVFQTLRGERVALGRCFQIAASRWPAVVGLSILTALAVGVGVVLCIIPGIVLACGLIAAAPVLMVEKRGVVESMERSWSLTRGYKGSIFFVSLAIVVIQWLVGLAFGLAVGQLGSPIAMAGANLLASGFGTALNAVAAAVVYHDVRGFREGLDEDELVAVFN